MTDKETFYGIKFWAPFTNTFENAEYSVTLLKSPELENKETKARNQSLVRTRAGNTLVYDRGNDFNTKMQLEFRDVPDEQRSALVVFLELIQWATTKVKYRDVYGDEYIVRIVADNGITYTDLGTNMKKGRSFLRWNFDLDLLNLTDNPGELEAVDTVATSALLLHIQDYADPHSPTTLFNVNDVDGEVVVDSVLTTEWRSVLWTILAVKGDASASFVIAAHHNRLDMLTVATAVEQVVEAMCEQGDVAAHITYTVELSGVSVDQIMRIKVNVNTDGWKFEVRKIKLGSQVNLYES